MDLTHHSPAVLGVDPIFIAPSANGRLAESAPSNFQQTLTTATEQLVRAARKRWPRFGPWRVEVSCRDDGHIEWKLQGRSWKVPDVGDKARIGGTLEDLERRVLVDRDE